MNFTDIRFNTRRGLWVLVFFVLFAGLYVLLRIAVLPPSHNAVSWTNNNFYVLDLSIPANLEFCGEKIPSNNLEIRDDLEKEFFSSAYWKANSLVLFRKAQKWFPYIEPILKEEGVPDDFKYVAVIESHLSNITSPAGASGFWQLLPASARNYGLEVNATVDERYHVEKATHAACRHFKDAYAVFGNWTLSAAAYNRGIGGIQAALKKQGTDNYFDLLLNRETGSFVYRILAYKTLFSSPGHFGIKKKKWNYFPKIPFTSFKVDSAVTDLAAFAQAAGSDGRTLRAFNPWLLQNSLPNPEGKVYEIRLPRNKKADYTSYLADLQTAQISRLPPAEQALLAEVSVEDTSVITTTKVVPEASAWRQVVVGDESLKALAARYKVKEEDILKWNKLSDASSLKGQTLTILQENKK